MGELDARRASSAPVVVSTAAKATHARLLGLVTSAGTQELLDQLAAAGQRSTVDGAAARAALETPIARRNPAWFKHAQETVARAATAPPADEEDLDASLLALPEGRWREEAVSLLRARGAPEPPADWRATARWILEEARKDAARTMAPRSMAATA